jgi:hypothetical protein
MGQFDGTIGSFVIGTILALFLSGVVAAQAFTFYASFPDERRVYWWLVTVLLLLDLTHSAISCYTVYFWCVTSFGNPAVLAISPFSFGIAPALEAFIATVVQSFYAYRVYIISNRNKWLPFGIMLGSLVGLGFATSATVLTFQRYNSEFARFHEFSYGADAWIAASSLSDLIITCSLIYYMLRIKNGFASTDSIAHRVARNALETNGLTLVVSLVFLILFLTVNEAQYVIVLLPLPKLYVNAVLVSFNARQPIAASLKNPTTTYGSPRNTKWPTQHRATPNDTNIGSGMGVQSHELSAVLSSPKLVRVDISETKQIESDEEYKRTPHGV